MDERSIAIVVPVLNRPDSVASLMENVASVTTVPYRLLFVASENDSPERRVLHELGADYVLLHEPMGRPGEYARKINLGYRATDEPYIFTGADDLRFHEGWDRAALACFAEGIGVVGTQDLCNPQVEKGEHSTHSLVARWYADEQGTIDGPGAIYAECYPHEWVDNELVETAKARGAWAFAAGSVVEHLHPGCSKGEQDRLYEQAPRRMAEGRRIYQQRRKRWQGHVRNAPISVIVATFGDESWKQLAEERAVRSVHMQRVPPAELIVVHGSSLAAARNEGARRATSPWLCFLDADDELNPGFLQAIAKTTGRPNAGLLNPAVRFIVDGKTKPARLFPKRDLRHGNYLVIGTVVRADLFWAAGGFDERWPAWEDWQCWRKVVALGGRIVQVPQAVYKAHWRADGRNNTIDDKEELMRLMQAEFDEWEAMR